MTIVKPEYLFDVHQHVGNLIGHIPGATKGSGTIEDDVRSRIACMDFAGIAQAALMPAHAYNASRGVVDIVAINDRLLAVRALAPDRFPVVAATVDPRHGPDALDEVSRLAAHGVQALSFHNRFQGLPVDHAMMFRIVERATDHGMVIMAHAYASGDFESPWRLRRLVEAFSQTRFIALDALTSQENLDQLCAMAESLTNLAIDLTAALLGVPGVQQAINRLGPDRLLFGTNFYSHGKTRFPADLATLLAATDDAAALKQMGGANARRIFSLDAGELA